MFEVKVCEWKPEMNSAWRVHSFDNELPDYRSPSKYFPHLPGGFRNRLRFMTAFALNVRRPYTIRLSKPVNIETVGGFMIWEGDRRNLPKSFGERRTMAEIFLEHYNLAVEGRLFSVEIDGLTEGRLYPCRDAYATAATIRERWGDKLAAGYQLGGNAAYFLENERLSREEAIKIAIEVDL